MRTNGHPWRRAHREGARRFFLGAIVAASFTLVAFEWKMPTEGHRTPVDMGWSDDDLEPMLNVLIQPEQRVEQKKEVSAVPGTKPAATTPSPSPEPVPEPTPIGGSTDPDPAPSPTVDPVPTKFVPSVSMKPYLPQCMAIGGTDLDRCTEDRIIQHLRQEFEFPRSIRGTVRTTITFRVEVDGSIGRIVCAPKVDPEILEEVERVLHALPSFEPGRQGDVPVPVYYQVPLSLRRG